jgi:hypothetical protein
MSFLRSFGRFWYDFVIGDDWKIAAGVVVALVVLCALMLATSLGDAVLAVIGGVLLVAAFAISLVLDVRSSGS